MGLKMRGIWTCDRCGTEIIFDSPKHKQQPRLWTRFVMLNPPLASIDSAIDVGTLCNECGGLAVAFMHSTTDDALKRAAAERDILFDVHLLGKSREPIGERVSRAARVINAWLHDADVAAPDDVMRAVNDLEDLVK